jgi:hypothetical protein
VAGEYERPEWALDAVNNPTIDDNDSYAAFDPENPELQTKAVALARNQGTKKSPDDELLSHARSVIKAYKAGKQIADNVEIQSYSLPAEASSRFKISDVAQFLFGDEMASLGISLDEHETRTRTEIAYQQWSEHPIRTSIAWASWMLPGLGKLAKIRRARGVAGIPDAEVVTKFDGIDNFLQASDEVKDLARAQLYHENKYIDLINQAASDPTSMTMKQKIQLWFHDNFAHQYSKLSDPSSSVAHNLNHKNRMNVMVRDEIVDPFLAEIPESLMGTEDLGKYLLGTKSLSQLPADAQTWVRNFETSVKEAQKHALDIAMITPGTVEKVGDMYVPLIRKDIGRVQKGAKEEFVVLKGKRPVTIESARLESDAFKARMTGREEFAEMMERREAFGDPKTLTMQGLMEQKMLIMNHEYVRDMFVHSKFSKSMAELKDAGEDLRKWVSIDQVPGSERLRRMIEKGHPQFAGQERFTRIDAFDQVFGKNGLVAQTREATRLFENLVRHHKTAKTAYNLFTHGQNIMGNICFLSQAGFRLFTGREARQNWGAVRNSMGNINDYYKFKTGKITEEALTFKSVTVGGRTFSPKDIRNELDNWWAKDIIEEGTFLATEGTNGGVIAAAAEKAADVNDFLGRLANSGKNFLDRSTRYYNVEDAGPKFAYYLAMRAKGLNPQAAATEVAKRLPIYHGLAAGPKAPIVGGLGPSSLRKWAFPWISFPAEAMRITKNNMVDYPLRMAAWLHAPQIMQSVVYAGSHLFGVGEPMSYTDYGGIRRGLPVYAQRPGAVVTPFKDKNDDFRAMMLDFIPHLSPLPGTVSPEASMAEQIPLVSPNDIAPILTGILGIMTGRGPFGQEIQAASKGEMVGKHIANFVGFVTPPYIQKYMFNLSSPREQSMTGLNVRRLEQDMGMVVNPKTGKPGSWLADLVLNNTVMRNYASSGEQELYNKEFHKARTVDRVRGELTRRFNASVRSGAEDEATQNLRRIMETFQKEYTPGPIAQRKFTEWLIRHRRSILKHPQLRRYSEEDLIRLLISNNESVTERRNMGLKNTMGAVRRELMLRQMQP